MSQFIINFAPKLSDLRKKGHSPQTSILFMRVTIYIFMVTNNASEMKIENSRTEDFISDPVFKVEMELEKIRALGEKVDKYRAAASIQLFAAIEASCISFYKMDSLEAMLYASDIYEKDGIVGLEKCAAKISDMLRLEYHRTKQQFN